MIWTCEKFAKSHNLQFSTDPNPVKCKTKLIAFSKHKDNLPTAKVYLCGNVLPWVDNVKHVGNTLTAFVDGMQKDMMIKRAQYIENVNCLQQEFHFAVPKTLWKLNMIYNFHFSGCAVWDLSTISFDKFIYSIHKSFKVMFDLPYATHRYFFEAITRTLHPALIIRKRFLGFLNMIEKSKKKAPSELLKIIQNDVRTTTGSNIRKLKIEFNDNNIDNIKIDRDVTMFHVPEDEFWRVGFVEEILQAKSAFFYSLDCEITTEMRNNIIEYLCIT